MPGAASPPPVAVLRAAYARGFTYALQLTRRKARADELVQAAMVAALDGPTAWDPSKHPEFDSHVCNLIWSHYGNASQSYEATHSEGPLTFAHENRRTDSLLDPEEALLDDAQESLAAQRTSALEARVADDPPVRLLLDATDTDDDSTARALAAGYSAREVEFARRRLARHIEAVVREFPNPSEDD